MENAGLMRVCKSCGFSGTENYCSRCGEPYTTKRVSLKGLLHDIFHFFTHLDRGFGYTVKQLIVSPGKMQREYVDGTRSKYQKPFSMFFICATIAALSRYWIYQTLHIYQNTGDVSEINFIHEYMVIFHIGLLPIHALLIYILFYNSEYNFAETGILVLYSVSIFFLFSVFTALFKIFWRDLDTAYVELPILLIYNTITCLKFFHRQSRWKVALKSIIFLLLVFLVVQLTEDFAIRLI